MHLKLGIERKRWMTNIINLKPELHILSHFGRNKFICCECICGSKCKTCDKLRNVMAIAANKNSSEACR